MTEPSQGPYHTERPRSAPGHKEARASSLQAKGPRVLQRDSVCENLEDPEAGWPTDSGLSGRPWAHGPHLSGAGAKGGMGQKLPTVQDDDGEEQAICV